MNRSHTIVNPSELRHRVQIQTPSIAQDTAGQPLTTYTTVLTPYVKIESLSQREQYQLNQISAEVTHRVTMRYTTTPITPGMCLLYAGRALRIQTQPVNVDERNVLLQLLCLEIYGN